MNSAMPGFFGTGSGTGPTGVGCIAGAITWNSAIKGVPLIKIAFPFFVSNVLFIGVNVTEIIPMPGVTKGGAVYGSGALSAGGNSSPSRQTGWLFTIKFVLVPISGIGAISVGTIAGGKIVIRIISPVFITKSAGMCNHFSSGFREEITLTTILKLHYQSTSGKFGFYWHFVICDMWDVKCKRKKKIRTRETETKS